MSIIFYHENDIKKYLLSLLYKLIYNFHLILMNRQYAIRYLNELKIRII